MKITVFYDNQKHFISPVIAHWKELGHEVRAQPYYDYDLVEEADLAFFEWVDNNLITASKDEEQPPAKVVTRCVDIDAYAKHPGSVNWSYVNSLIFGAEHIEELVRGYVELPEDLNVVHVPFGVNLDKWTFAERDPGLNIAWIGRRWIAKNLSTALMIVKSLRENTGEDYQLFLRADKGSPKWYLKYCFNYIEVNEMESYVHQVPFQDDLDSWLEDMNYLLLTSFKEAFSYVTAEAMAKGIKPVISDFWGARDIWPRELIWTTEAEAIEQIRGGYNSRYYRDYIETFHSLKGMLQSFDSICFED